MAPGSVLSNKPSQGSMTFFCKRPDDKYIKHFRPWSAILHKGSHTQYVNIVHGSSYKTLLTKTDSGSDLACRPWFSDNWAKYREDWRFGVCCFEEQVWLWVGGGTGHFNWDAEFPPLMLLWTWNLAGLVSNYVITNGPDYQEGDHVGETLYIKESCFPLRQIQINSTFVYHRLTLKCLEI